MATRVTRSLAPTFQLCLEADFLERFFFFYVSVCSCVSMFMCVQVYVQGCAAMSSWGAILTLVLRSFPPCTLRQSLAAQELSTKLV